MMSDDQDELFCLEFMIVIQHMSGTDTLVCAAVIGR